MLFETCASPLGDIIICAHEGALRGLWFSGQKYECRGADRSLPETPGDRELLYRCRRWLEAYFAGSRPRCDFPLNPQGSEFQKRVWRRLEAIPYGETLSYGALAAAIDCKSARAVGGAVGKNPISLIIPCHRVLGSGGAITGYAGGTDRKIYLLALEKGNLSL